LYVKLYLIDVLFVCVVTITKYIIFWLFMLCWSVMVYVCWKK
jgi:hypothetical protein